MTQALHHQVAALCWRSKSSRTEILLVTSRDTGRWVLPKGWPMEGLKDNEAAAREAYEEAGVDGEMGEEVVGHYGYEKFENQNSKHILVTLYPLAVQKQFADWPERAQRKRAWFVAADAAQRVAEPGLAAILRNFRP